MFMDQSFIINHLGEDRENYFNAVAPPVMQSSNFSFPNVGEMRAGLKKEWETPFYTRGYNPTVGMLRKKLAALAGSEDALVFSSGSAAVAAAVMSTVQAGDHVICVQKPYSWTNKLLLDMLSRYGVETTMVDGTNPENFEDAVLPNTRLIFLESPNSMTFELQDIPAVVAIAKAHGITTAIDNSYSTMLNQKVIEMGVDMSIHSASKYLNGHSDVVAGVLCASAERIDRIFGSEFMTLGGIIAPHEAWLILRGLRTLEIRLERSAASTLKVVDFLESHPKVSKVHFPFSDNHPQQALAKKQMKSCGGLFSIELAVNDIDAVDRFCDGLSYFVLACSWGGYESLAFPMSALYDSQNYDNPDLPWNLVRLFVGLEDPESLIKDLGQALDKI
jgi:cystathionine beta-lyase